MNLMKTLRLPREHGAWAMVYVPFLMGALIAGRFGAEVLLLLGAVTFTFVSRESLLTWWRSRRRERDPGNARYLLLIYLFLALICGLPLIVIYRKFLLLPLATIGLLFLILNGWQAADREDRKLRNEMLAIGAMALTAPAAYYVAGGKLDVTAVWLWFLNLAFFASSVFYIRLQILAVNPRKKEERSDVWKTCALYHGFLFAALAGLILTRNLSLFVGISLVPILIRALIGLIKPAERLNLKRAGMLEFVWALIFLTMTTIGLAK